MSDSIHGTVREQTSGEVHVHANQRDGSHNQTDENDVAPHLSVDHAIGEFARFACHHVVGGRVDTHGERRSCVGKQVDPQQLRGEQRHGDTLAARLGDAEESGEHHTAEDGEHLADVGAQQIAQELTDVVENATAFAHRLDDGAEVVVGEDHLGTLLGNFGTGDAHRDADVRGFDGGRVVHAVAGHGHDIALPLQRFDDFQLVFRRNARVHGDFAGGLVERLLVRQLVELNAGEHFATKVGAADRAAVSVRFNNAQIAGDACRGKRMVTGNHDGADAGAMRFGDGIAHFGTRRIDDADHADPDQVAFQHIALVGDVGDVTGGVDAHARHCGERSGAERTVGLAQRAVRFGGQAFHGGEDLLAIALRHRSYGTVDRDAAAVAEQYIGGTLGEDGETPGIGVVLRDDGHAFAVGGEWNLADARVVGVFAIGLHLACGDDKRHFGRVADGFPRYVGSSGTIAGTCVFAQFAVVGQRAHCERGDGFKLCRFLRGRRGGCKPGIGNRNHSAFWRIAGAGQLHLTARRDHAFHRHLVAGERTGFVGADHRRGTERFHGMQFLDDRMMFGHAAHAEREHDCQNRGEPFRHGRDGQRNG